MRLILLAAFALCSFCAAGFAAWRLVQTTKTFALFQAENDARAAARELARAIEASPDGFDANALQSDSPTNRKGAKRDLPPHVREILTKYDDSFERLAAVALNRSPNVSGGFYRAADEEIFGFVGETGANLDSLKTVLRENANQTRIVSAGNGQFLIVAELTETGVTAFAVRRVPDFAASDLTAFLALGLLSLTVVAVVGFAFVSIRDLRRDTAKITGELAILDRNLGAEISAPETLEFAAIVGAINRLSANLRSNLEERQQLEKDLRQSEKLSALGRVAAGAAHEIRNPLAAIKLKIQLAERRGVDENLSKTFRVVAEEIERLDKIVKRLLQFGKRQKLDFSMVDLTALLNERADFFGDFAARQDIRTKRENLENPIFINADEKRLIEVFDNLLKNALNAMPTGGELILTIENLADFVRIKIADSGVGISEPEKIFEPFFTTRDDGTGLGLAISREIVEAHGGRIRFETFAGKGATFFVELPHEPTIQI